VANDSRTTGDAQTKAKRPEQFSIPAELVEHILLGPTGDRRVLQDSPLLGDVWAAYALDPGTVQDVLITPHKDTTAARVASRLPDALKQRAEDRKREKNPTPAPHKIQKPKIAYLQGLVGARLYFDEVLCILVPATQWWHEPKVKDRIENIDPEKLKRLLKRKVYKPGEAPNDPAHWETFTSLERYIALAGLIYWLDKLPRPKVERLEPLKAQDAFEKYQPHVDQIVDGMLTLYQVLKKAAAIAAKSARKKKQSDDDALEKAEGSIFQVSLNRIATAALERSVPAVKADAARTLFKVGCKGIVWAVLDSGIEKYHDAFMMKDESATNGEGKARKISRVRKTFDFTSIREIVSNDKNDMELHDLAKLMKATGLSKKEIEGHLDTIASDFKEERPINWAVVEQLVTVKNPTPPSNQHGTHVAGIIGADQCEKNGPGMCPDIRLYDFRVLGRTSADTEFAVISALQYIRWVNERHSYITIHGANLSLSIPHSVRNFACGRTPVCNECERLVESGVVVVAAAGNHGYQRFETSDGLFENYAAFSITDPGNADGVITVGSTHSIWPHTYGVSFFSSRGPTGDGRLKPDIVAPGERIQSTVPGTGADKSDWAPESGTSMAAPHVSGAAAMLLARYEELIGQPRRVKRILCETATDLGRERSFQGHGMLDVLRAFQSI
jgi:hypothetical protein